MLPSLMAAIVKSWACTYSEEVAESFLLAAPLATPTTSLASGSCTAGGSGGGKTGG